MIVGWSEVGDVDSLGFLRYGYGYGVLGLHCLGMGGSMQTSLLTISRYIQTLLLACDNPNIP